MKAQDLIKAGQKTIVLFTKGYHFAINPQDHTGTIGWWKISATRQLDRVIIYERNQQTKQNTIYVADYAGKTQRSEDNRYTLHLTNIQNKGTTPLNWLQFAKGSQTSVQYFT